MKRYIRTSEKPGGDILATTWVADIRSLHRRPPSEFARNLQPSRLSGKLLYRELAPGKLGMHLKRNQTSMGGPGSARPRANVV